MTKTLFIGLDSADRDLLLQWASDGSLPTFRRLFEEGAWGATSTPPGMYVGATWPSFFTGVSPGRHGRYSDLRLIPGTYETKKFKPSDLGFEPFWEALSRAGLRVAVIDVPAAPLAEGLNGMQVVGWGTHDSENGYATCPPSLAKTIAEDYGLDPVGHCDYGGRGPKDIRLFLDGLVERIGMKTRLCEDLLKNQRWDLFIAAYSESHCVGHQGWHLHDPGHPRHDSHLAAAIGDPLKAVYMATDDAIGRLLRCIGEDTTVFVFSSHGMSAPTPGATVLDAVLRRLEQEPSGRARTHDALRDLWLRLPKGLRGPFDGVKERVREGLMSSDRARRKSFALSVLPACGAVRVNLVTREPHGKIQPGIEFEKFCEALSRDFLEIRDRDSGEPWIRTIRKTSDLYPRTSGDSLPDLLIEWNDSFPSSVLYSEKLGELRIPPRGNRTGDHRPGGLLLGRGSGIAPEEIERPIPVTDIAPTLAARLGVALRGVDGSPIPELS